MPRDKKPLKPEIADGLLLGLALLTDADADLSQLEAPPQEAVVGLLCVAQLALGDVIAATGKAPGAALAEVRALALSMADEDFAESAETMWAAVYLEASREWPDLHTGQAVTALRHGGGGLGGAAAILMVMAANHRGIAEQDVIDEYRALAIESLATA